MNKKINYENVNLYHYTTLDGLYGIVSNKTIRLTDYRFLNDKKELVHSIDFLETILNGYEKNKYIGYISEALTAIRSNQASDFICCGKDKNGTTLLRQRTKVKTNFYILSMTRKSDDLALWSMYGKSGCRIKFNSQKLFEFFNKVRDEIATKGIFDYVGGNVLYGDTAKTNEESILKFYQENWDVCCLNLYRDLYRLLSLRKKQSYSYENEYRIGIPIPDDFIDGTRLKKIFTLSQDCIKPRLEFSDFPVADVIENVIISPFNTSDCVLLGIEEFLENELGRKIEIKNSAIEIRN